MTMKLLPLIPVLLHICLISGSPVAEAEAKAEAEAQNQYEGGSRIMYNQMGGPGYRNRYEPYQNPGGYQPGNTWMYTRGQSNNDLSAQEAKNMDGYGTLQMPVAGNVQAMEQPEYGYQAGNAALYARGAPGAETMDTEIQSEGVEMLNAPGTMGARFMSQPPAAAFNTRPAMTYPLMPVNNYQPLNNQGQMFTRSYTPLPGTGCMNVCRTRPMINAPATCRPSCNSNTACSMNRPQVDYAVQGSTTFCKPRPIVMPYPVQPQGCGSYSSGGCGSSYNGYGGQGYNPGYQTASILPAPIKYETGSTGCSSGVCGQTGCAGGNCGSGCPSGLCGGGFVQQPINQFPFMVGGGGYPQQAVNLPAQLGAGWRDSQEPICLGSGCNQSNRMVAMSMTRPVSADVEAPAEEQ